MTVPGRRTDADIAARSDVHRRAPTGRLTTMPTGSGISEDTGVEVEALGESGDDEGEFHLRQREADAVAGAASERHPRHIGECPLVVVEVDEPVGIEPKRVRPCRGVAAGEVCRPEDQRAFRDRVAADGHVDRRLAGAQDTRWVEAYRLTHHSVGEIELGERARVWRRRARRGGVPRRLRPGGDPRDRGTSVARISIHASDADVVS